MKPRDIGILWPYYGGKWRAALRYPRPRGRIVVEPFAGAGNYSLRWAQAGSLINAHLYDLDDNVAGVWRYLLRVTPEEILRLPDVPPDGSVDDLDIPPEAKLLVGWWLCPAQKQPGKRMSTWGLKYPDHRRVWSWRTRERVAMQLRYIRGWQFHQADYRESARHDGADVTFFVDPPYQRMGYAYRRRHNSRWIDFVELGAWCQQRQGMVIACENEGATWLPFEPLADVQARKGRSREVVWTSDPDWSPRPRNLLDWLELGSTAGVSP